MSQPSMSEVHELEQELSRRYEVSKEVEHSILGPVPSILESGRMANTSTDIDRSLRMVSECYAQRCQLRDQLCARLNMPQQPPVPVMTFDRYHNLVPKVGPSNVTQGGNTNTSGANRIKLDNMEIEVSNEIMAMIYYRALMSKFERLHSGGSGDGKKTEVQSPPLHSNPNQGPVQAHGKGVKPKKQSMLDQKPSCNAEGEPSVRGAVDEEDDEDLDSSSETDISRLDLSRSLTTREMRIRSLQRYSPRLHATMLPVIETEDERYLILIFFYQMDCHEGFFAFLGLDCLIVEG
jgi:hypothetical protein